MLSDARIGRSELTLASSGSKSSSECPPAETTTSGENILVNYARQHLMQCWQPAGRSRPEYATDGRFTHLALHLGEESERHSPSNRVIRHDEVDDSVR